MTRCDRGQAGIELALILAVLLVILLGITDVGRAFYYTSAVASAAHSGAAAYAADPNADLQNAACGALGPAPTCTAIRATYPDPQNSLPIPGCSPDAPIKDAAVQATYRFQLVSGFLVTWIPIFSTQEINIRACATAPRVPQ